jgi:hypothetical protein
MLLKFNDELFDKLTDHIEIYPEEKIENFFNWVQKDYKQSISEESENGFYFSVVSRHLVLHGFGEPFLDKNLLKRIELSNMYQDPNKYGGMLHGYKGAQWNDEQKYNSARESYYDTSFKPKCTNYYGGDDTPKEDDRETTYIWTEPKQKDPGADYKPGKFKYLDEAIKNTKKDS